MTSRDAGGTSGKLCSLIVIFFYHSQSRISVFCLRDTYKHLPRCQDRIFELVKRFSAMPDNGLGNLGMIRAWSSR